MLMIRVLPCKVCRTNPYHDAVDDVAGDVGLVVIFVTKNLRKLQNRVRMCDYEKCAHKYENETDISCHIINRIMIWICPRGITCTTTLE